MSRCAPDASGQQPAVAGGKRQRNHVLVARDDPAVDDFELQSSVPMGQPLSGARADPLRAHSTDRRVGHTEQDVTVVRPDALGGSSRRRRNTGVPDT